MFRFIVAFVVVASLASAAVMDIPILKSSSEVRADGFAYEWETGNGIKAEARGSMKDAETQSVQGSFSFTADDGQVYEVKYIADENGFQPQGAHLPTPPPMPEAIARALEWIAAHPEPKGKAL